MAKLIDNVRKHTYRKTQRLRHMTIGGTTIYDVVQADGYYTLTDELHGSTNPDYKRAIKTGKNASTNLTASQMTYHNKGAYVLQWVDSDHPSPNPAWGTDYETSGTYPFPYAIPCSGAISSRLITKASNRAKTEFVRKIRSYQTAVEGGTLLGELAQSIRMIRNPAQGLRRGTGHYLADVKRHSRSARRLRTRAERVRELSKIAADSWLEYSLGWRPLISELRDAINAMKPASNYQDHQRIVGFGEAQDTLIKPGYRTTSGIAGHICDEVNTYTAFVKYYGSIGAGPSAGRYAARRIGLDASNLLPTAWELVPYSFVSDYFVNVGDIISAYSLNTSGLRWASKVSVIDTNMKVVFRQLTYKWPKSFYLAGYPARRVDVVYPGACTSTHKQVQRDREIGSLVPTLEFSLPFAGTQWLNIAALYAASDEIRKLVRI